MNWILRLSRRDRDGRVRVSMSCGGSAAQARTSITRARWILRGRSGLDRGSRAGMARQCARGDARIRYGPGVALTASPTAGPARGIVKDLLIQPAGPAGTEGGGVGAALAGLTHAGTAQPRRPPPTMQGTTSAGVLGEQISAYLEPALPLPRALGTTMGAHDRADRRAEKGIVVHGAMDSASGTRNRSISATRARKMQSVLN